MTWTQIARKDFEDAVRSKLLWGLLAVFVGFMGFVIVVTATASDANSGGSGAGALAVVAQLGQLFVPLLALIAGYLAIVGERREGSLRVLLGYPHSRRDVVLGKYVGRSAVVAVTLALGVAASGLLVAVLVEAPDLRQLAGLGGSVVLFGVSFAGLAVGLSAAVRTRGKAMALAIGLLLTFWLVWDAVAAGAYAAATGSFPGLHADAWYFLLQRLSPVGAFHALANSFLDGQVSSMFVLGLEEIPEDASAEQLRLANRVRGPLPFYLTDWFAALTLAAWGAVPTLLGYLRFRRSEL